jgi:hypothetical protein
VDQKTLNAYEYLHLVGSPVVLVAGDTGMTICAGKLGIKVVEMPQRYLR